MAHLIHMFLLDRTQDIASHSVQPAIRGDIAANQLLHKEYNVDVYFHMYSLKISHVVFAAN